MSKHDHDQGRNHDRGAAGFPPVPWLDVAAASSAADVDVDVERRIGALFAKVPEPSAFNAVAQARVGARLRASARRSGGLVRGWTRRRLVMGWALGAIVLLVSGAVIAGGGVSVLWQRLKPGRDAASASVDPGRPMERRNAMRGRRTDLATREVAAPTPAPVPAVAEDKVADRAEGEAAPAVRQRQRLQRRRQIDGEPPARPRPRRSTGSRYALTEGRAAEPVSGHSPSEAARLALASGSPVEEPSRAPPVVEPSSPWPSPSPASSWAPAAEPPPSSARRAPAAPSPVTPPSQLSQEARLLNMAMVQLRQRRDGAAALAALNEYLDHYPQGMLAGEARGARIDALLLLQRKGEALKALDATRLEPVGRGQELLVIRGELRARRDCAGAIRDFELVLGRAAPAPLEERALFGRAVCRRRQGNEEGARADGVTYLARFPEGRFASSVRRLTLGENGRAP